MLLADQLDLLRDAAEVALAAGADIASLAAWLRLYYRIGRSYRGMSAYLAGEPRDTGIEGQGGHGRDDPESPMMLACSPMRAAFAVLVTDEPAPEMSAGAVAGRPLVAGSST
ncbi:hypothetical protein OHA10_24635 [Kribbella sp. NBC_00662]|uniref:hypothetical protein n=1 Tax=Kribbella sp. NBC_00662 TaxID=2975969 RepID=UPI00324BC5A3